MGDAKKSIVSLATEPFCVIKVVFLWCDAKNTANIFASSIMELIQVIIFLLVFLRCEDETILPGVRGKVGGLLHRSRENAAFSAIIPEFCSVFRGVLQ